MLRLTLEYLPFGEESRAERIGTMEVVNDGTGAPERGNYDVEIALEPSDRFGRFPTRTRVFGFERLPDARGRAWDLVYVALRDMLAGRNPWRPRPGDERAIYVKQDGKYVPVKEFEGFPATGVFLVYRDAAEGPGCHASFRWIGDIPEADALTYAAAHVHKDAALKALDGFTVGRTFSRENVVSAVLNAIASGEVEARGRR